MKSATLCQIEFLRSEFFAILNGEGVTSKISSEKMYSTEASRDISIGAIIPVVMPFVAE
jgi:hypothetical protein